MRGTEIHADAADVIPRALCDRETDIHSDNITEDDGRVTCAECLNILADIRSLMMQEGS